MRIPGLLLVIVYFCSVAFAGERSDLKIGDDYLDLEYRAGAGPLSSIVIVDFAATGGNTYAFEYRHDGTQNGHDALLEIAGAGDLGYQFSEFDFGILVGNFSLRSEVGDAGLYWAYSVGDHDSSTSVVSWAESPVGARDRILTDGSWDGWYNGFETPPIEPAIPILRLPGDYNNDGQVAQEDLDLVLLNWGGSPEIAGWVNQRPTDDGLVDQNDLDDVLLYWGDTWAVSTQAVPEPTAALLGCLGMLLWSARTCFRFS